MSVHSILLDHLKDAFAGYPFAVTVMLAPGYTTSGDTVSTTPGRIGVGVL